MSAAERVQVPGSERALDPDHSRVGDADSHAAIDVTVYLRPRATAGWIDAEAQRPPAQRRRMTREQWAQNHGADPADIDAVASFARAAGLEVTASDAGRRTVSLRGPLSVIANAFGAQVEGQFRTPDGSEYRARSGPLMVPAALGDIVAGVFGIDDRPQARPHLQRAAAGAASFTPPQVAQAYAFPPSTGAGETVGIIELGGGFSTTDLVTYFNGLGITPPSVTAVTVDGGKNSPGSDPNSDGEVMLDIEVVGAVAPGATIVVYFAPNTDQGFIDALSNAVHDTTHHPSIVSISWGQSEDSWSSQARQQMEQIMTDAGGLGVTVTVAAGDNGSTDSVTDGQQHVDFPASAPHALACGGTSLTVSGTQISSETVWKDASGATGGGVSRQFPLPSYQSAAKVPDNVDSGASGRGVPDVCADADPQTGYEVRVDGAQQTIGGTSAVAPLWAALIARINEQLGAPVGFAQPRLYPLLGAAAFHDISQGDNGSYSAGPGWDACTGLGSPDGTALASALGAPAAKG
jgi:kumamolisin